MGFGGGSVGKLSLDHTRGSIGTQPFGALLRSITTTRSTKVGIGGLSTLTIGSSEGVPTLHSFHRREGGIEAIHVETGLPSLGSTTHSNSTTGEVLLAFRARRSAGGIGLDADFPLTGAVAWVMVASGTSMHWRGIWRTNEASRKRRSGAATR